MFLWPTDLSPATWSFFMMDPVERKARVLCNAREGNEDNWKNHAWDAYTALRAEYERGRRA